MTGLLGMAWASLVTLCLGVQATRERLAILAKCPLPVRARRPAPTRSQHAWASLFTLRQRRVRYGRYQAWAGAFPWRLAEVDIDRWTAQWQSTQATVSSFKLPAHEPPAGETPSGGRAQHRRRRGARQTRQR